MLRDISSSRATKKSEGKQSTHSLRSWSYREVYRVEILLHITCQIISESKHPLFCFPRFVSIWPAPEVVDGIFEVCPAATKFCPLVNKPVALGFSLWWQLFEISKHFCPLVRLGPKSFSSAGLSVELFHVMSRAFDRHSKMRLRRIAVPRESYIVKKESEIFILSSLLLRLKLLSVR